MKPPRGFASILLLLVVVVICLLVVGGWWYVWSQHVHIPSQLTDATATTTESAQLPPMTRTTSSEGVFDPATIKVGDVVDGFTVTQVGPFKGGIPESLQNKVIVFSGDRSMLMAYKWSGFGNNYIEVASSTESGQLPSDTTGQTDSFCTTGDQDTLFTQAGISSGSLAQVTFDSIKFVYYPSDGCFPNANITKVEKPAGI